MDSLVDALNALLVNERGVMEAASELVNELKPTDPDIADSARGVIETAKWSCTGLYHRINHLDGTVTLDVSDLAGRVADAQDIPQKIREICRQQTRDRNTLEHTLDRDDLDDDTRGFLEDMLNVQCETVDWCESTLKQWEPGS